MLDQIMTTLIAIVGVVLIFGLFFFAWALWTIRESLFKLFKTIRRVWKEIKEDNYTRDELIYNVQYFIARNRPKSADYWRSEIVRKYPEEPYNG